MFSLFFKDALCYFKENKGYVFVGYCTGLFLGMEIELDFLLGGFRGEILLSYVFNLNIVFFFDEQLVGLQEGVVGFFIIFVVLVVENTNL